MMRVNVGILGHTDSTVTSDRGGAMIDPRLADPTTGRVDLDRWAERVDVRAAVGTCRSCGGLLAGEAPTVDRLTGLTDLPCRCLVCGAEFALPVARQIVTPNLTPA